MLVAKAGQETCSVYTILKLTSALSSPLVLGLFAILPAAVALAGEPPADDAASIERGSQLFQLYCTECHGRDGRAQMDVISDATDLTDPEAYYSGSSAQDIFTSINSGAGVAMPAWGPVLNSDDKIWDLVHFTRSLWTQQQREDF
jgi:mono/diheme cytochrome c family protein